MSRDAARTLGERSDLVVRSRLGTWPRKLALLLLHEYMGQNPGQWPSIRTLAENGCCSPRLVSKAIGELVVLRIVTYTDQRHGVSSRSYAIDYELLRLFDRPKIESWIEQRLADPERTDPDPRTACAGATLFDPARAPEQPTPFPPEQVEPTGSSCQPRARGAPPGPTRAPGAGGPAHEPAHRPAHGSTYSTYHPLKDESESGTAPTRAPGACLPDYDQEYDKGGGACGAPDQATEAGKDRVRRYQRALMLVGSPEVGISPRRKGEVLQAVQVLQTRTGDAMGVVGPVVHRAREKFCDSKVRGGYVAEAILDEAYPERAERKRQKQEQR